MTEPIQPTVILPAQEAHTSPEPKILVRAEGIFGMISLHGGSLITVDHHGIGALSAKTRHVEVPISAVVKAELTEPNGRKNGHLDLMVRTTEGDTVYDPKGANPLSVDFATKDLADFQTLAEAINGAKPVEPVAIDPLNPKNKVPFWKNKTVWITAAVLVVFCCLVNSCGGSTSGTAATSNATGQSQTKTTTDQAAEKKRNEELQSQADGYKEQDGATVINDLESKGLLGTVKTGVKVPSDQVDTIKGGIANGTSYIVTDATVDNGKIDLIVDVTEHYNRERDIAAATTEQRNALTKAKTYSNMMDMSRRGIYDQLTSQYGDKFSADDANWALDHLQADYNANALAKAKTYQSAMSMSAEAIRDQLASQYGDQFTDDEANYAIEHLND